MQARPLASMSLEDRFAFADRVTAAATFERLTDADKQLIVESESDASNAPATRKEE